VKVLCSKLCPSRKRWTVRSFTMASVWEKKKNTQTPEQSLPFRRKSDTSFQTPQTNKETQYKTNRPSGNSKQNNNAEGKETSRKKKRQTQNKTIMQKGKRQVERKGRREKKVNPAGSTRQAKADGSELLGRWRLVTTKCTF